MSASDSNRGARKNQGDSNSRTQGQNQPTKDVTNQQRKTKNGPPNPNTQQAKPPTSPVVAVQEEHIPLNGFNSREVEIFLSKGVDTKATIYKADTKPHEKKTSPWGAKPGSMANGRDFFVELRKQVTALQQSGGVSQGG